MRISIFSDLHLEFSQVEVDVAQSDLVILAGDIHTKCNGILWAKEYFSCPVLYIPGNHEYYGGNIQSLVKKFHQAARYSNVVVLDNDSKIIGGTLFIGATLWTDFELIPNKCRQSKDIARDCLNDFKQTRINDDGRYRLLTPDDTVRMFKQSVSFIKQELERNDVRRKVVITHHAPSYLSESPKYHGSRLSPAFISDLEPIIRKYQPALWIHGHTHHSVDYKVGKTRVVSNQRGYPNEVDTGFCHSFSLKI